MTDPYREHRNQPQEPWNQPPAVGGQPPVATGPGSHGTAVPPPPYEPTHVDDRSRGQQTKDQAKDSARHVADDTKQAGAAVADTAKAEARGVKDDAVREGRKLWNETSATLSTQASDQLNRAAGTVRTFTDDLGRMSRGEQPEQGLATDLAQQLTDRTGAVADWLETHEPADVLTEVQRFARRRPVAFLAIAAGIGFAAGRLTRSVAQNHTSDDDQDTWSSRTGDQSPYAPPAGAQYQAVPQGQQAYPYDAPVPPAEPTRPVPPRIPETDHRGDIR